MTTREHHKTNAFFLPPLTLSRSIDNKMHMYVLLLYNKKKTRRQFEMTLTRRTRMQSLLYALQKCEHLRTRLVCLFFYSSSSFFSYFIFRSMFSYWSHFCISLILSHIINFHKFKMHFSPQKYKNTSLCCTSLVFSFFYCCCCCWWYCCANCFRLYYRREKTHWIAAKVFWHNLCKCSKMIHHLQQNPNAEYTNEIWGRWRREWA